MLLVLWIMMASGLLVPHMKTTGFNETLLAAFDERKALVIDAALPEETLRVLSEQYLVKEFGETTISALQNRYSFPSVGGQGRFHEKTGMPPHCENSMSLQRFFNKPVAEIMSRNCKYQVGDFVQAKLMFEEEDSYQVQKIQTHISEILANEKHTRATVLMNERSTGLHDWELLEIKLLFQPRPYYFPFHYDCYERFILQLDGEKTMYIYPNLEGAADLHERGIFLAKDLKNDSKLETFRLQKGQMLYIPAFTYHMVEVDERSTTLVLSYNREDDDEEDSGKKVHWWTKLIQQCEADFDLDYPIRTKQILMEDLKQSKQ
jgi:hypothetical protein